MQVSELFIKMAWKKTKTKSNRTAYWLLPGLTYVRCHQQQPISAAEHSHMSCTGDKRCTMLGFDLFHQMWFLEVEFSVPFEHI